MRGGAGGRGGLPSLDAVVAAVALGAAAGTLAVSWMTLEGADGHVLSNPAAAVRGQG